MESSLLSQSRILYQLIKEQLTDTNSTKVEENVYNQKTLEAD